MTELTELRGKEEEERIREHLRKCGNNQKSFVSSEPLFIPTAERRLTEIDALFISSSGIFIIESKHMTGTVSGKAGDRLWTKTGDGHVISFTNPVQQNRKHLGAAADYFQVNTNLCKSIIVFNDECDLQNAETGYGALLVKTSNLEKTIEQLHTEEKIPDELLTELIRKAEKLPSGKKATEQHLSEIKETKQRRRSDKKRGR
ncbi:MAG TPA: nuclease-related domain-containing protein [Methanocorpusculum sp.]|nr:nuclease-related domain-containing protein [Methanocorpusculum sp.]